MSKQDQFNYWYAVNNTEVVLMPTRRLETFGATMLNYHMLSELMDTVNQVRVREGRIQAFRPQIITPTLFTNSLLEGFGKEAEEYVEWLRRNASDLPPILRYGFMIKKEEISQHIVTENLQQVLEQVRQSVKQKDDPLSAIVVGVDNPWEVSLVKLMLDVIRNSAPGNVRDLRRSRMLDREGGVPRAVRMEVEADFSAAERDSTLVKRLGKKLQEYGLFEEYQDRFFALLNSKGLA